MFESHFQEFGETADPSFGAPRLDALRAQLRTQGLDGFLIPRADAHQNEYVAPCEERLAWLTGFTGSAGFVIVLADSAALFVDGRYTIQAREQVDATAFELVALAEQSPSDWLAAKIPAQADKTAAGAKIGYDPWLHTNRQLARFEAAAKKAGATLVGVDANPIDALWRDRPAPPRGKIFLHPLDYAGEPAADKVQKIAQNLTADALLISDPHALAWSFNLRGADVAHTPIALGFGLIFRNERPQLFLDPRKLDAEVAQALGEIATLRDAAELEAALQKLGEQKARVQFDAATAPIKLTTIFAQAGGEIELTSDPIALLKARKNPVELAGAREAHLRDGAAMVRFLAWFDRAAARGKLTEIDAAQAAETFRRETGFLRDISFPTISAAGAHAALPHYRVTEKSNVKIGRGVYLIDSGAQYLDGTTDVTRTLAVGRPSKPLMRANTLVLKGHIAIARAVFPKGTSGAQLDAFARRPLWEAGLDFDHGVGHGVGSYLSVHEGPQRISKLGATPLEPGMILSNEPGYYREGAFGIRIENLIAVEPRDIKGAERDMLGFETLTMIPIDRRLIEVGLLTKGEKAWLDAYHARLRKALWPRLDKASRSWLKDATLPL